MPRYTTRQREALLDYLGRHPDQPLTVREIAAGVEPDGVSLSAVYRNLAELAAASLLTGMAAGEGFSLDLTRTALYGLCPRCRQEVQP